MKTVIQSEASECGLACLAMVLSAFGSGETLRDLRRRFAPSLKGAKLSQLIEVAGQLDLRARPLRTEPTHLEHLRMPCVLHWDLNHFVVLERVRRGRYYIADPAVGERRLTYDEVSRSFTGIALELSPNTDFAPRPAPPPVSLARLTGRISGLWVALAQVALLSLAIQGFAIAAPFYMQWVVDQVLVSADRDLLAVLGIGFGLALALQVAIGWARGWAVIYLSSQLGLQWMGNVFAHLLRLPLHYFEKRHLGDISSRMASIQEIQKTLTTSFVEAVIDGLMSAVTLALMIAYSWKLAMVTVAAIGLYMGARLLALRAVRDRTEQKLVAGALQQTHLLESLRGMQSIKVAGVEATRRAAQDNLMVDLFNADVRLSRITLAFSTANQLLFGAERIAIVWLGAALALHNAFSVGMLVAYLAYKDQFAQRTAALVDKWIEFRLLRLHGERLADIVLTEPEPVSADVVVLEPRITMDHVSFRYSDSEPWVLKDCSVTIEPGDSVAIIGASGGGKTTLLKLLLGLLEPGRGTVSVAGYDLATIGPRSLRSMCGVVMQDDQLFAGSIADNISFFDPEFDAARIEESARLAAVHDDIAAMPMGYHSLIGDMGSSLSGGQKQRVILARALYRRPKLLLLDEATSHLDVASERLVNDAIKRLAVTRIIVAHRPETIASADRVLMLDSGALRELARTSVRLDDGVDHEAEAAAPTAAIPA